MVFLDSIYGAYTSALVSIHSFIIFGSYYKCSDAILRIHYSSESPGPI